MSSVQVQQPVALEVTAAAARKVRRLVDEEGNSQLKLRVFVTGLGWKSVGLLELTALPSIGAERWVPWIRAADALLVDGGWTAQ